MLKLISDWSNTSSHSLHLFFSFLQRKHPVKHEFCVEHGVRLQMQISSIANVGVVFCEYTTQLRIYRMLLQHSSARSLSFRAREFRVIPPDADWINSAREKLSEFHGVLLRMLGGSAPVSDESEMLIALTLCLRWWSWHQVNIACELSRQSQLALR